MKENKFETCTELALYLSGGFRAGIQGDEEYQQVQSQLNEYLEDGTLERI